MSLLVVGISHRSAPLELLEQVSLDGARSSALATGVAGLEDVNEALVLTTCNRTEVYADVLGFHGAVAQVGRAIATSSGVPLDVLTDHLYVHYEDRAVDHLFSLACGLESMALGESEILGQLREALRTGQEHAQLGAQLNPLFQQALRVGKRAHTETGLDQVARSLVGMGLDRARTLLGPLEEVRALVIGAGAMSGLAAASMVRAGVRGVHVLNRTPGRAVRLARTHGGEAHDWSALPEQLSRADLVITCTGATDHVITHDVLDRAGRADAGSRPLVVVDLAMPRDVAPEVADSPGVSVWSLAELHGEHAQTDDSPETTTVLATVRELVTGEVAAYLATRRTAQVAPTLAVMRSRAAAVADAELARLDEKLPDLSETERAQVHQSVRRIVGKLLHTPTVRAKERAAQDADGSYVEMLRELFDLDPRATAAVDRVPRVSRLP
ncbi:glutamyl-tRNA reductase [Ornithinimicrobium cryptoxanthini]|uniref:glutamyl-tRNA reductase n=1 Tax=Ornithinimicrobium cryptoxanthini TaxID=2934161 RepID=UPI0021189A7F|nr:glutamyl-tRNA reductase [Ornithinimicrobium cryptoxanthini]